ncbi:MAG: hypothetical protein SGILL_004615, partial [Bacillariaceae sp.]
NGTTKSLKMSMGKKMLLAKENEALARELYTYMNINGIQYCRRHLMVRCHLCEVDATHTQDGANEDRDNLGLRRGGDPRLNERAERWHEEILTKQFEARIKIDTMNAMYGQGTTEQAEQFQQMKTDSKADEREINDRFLKENEVILKNQGASTCCYWACQTPDGIPDKPLLRRNGTRPSKELEWRLLRLQDLNMRLFDSSTVNPEDQAV